MRLGGSRTWRAGVRAWWGTRPDVGDGEEVGLEPVQATLWSALVGHRLRSAAARHGRPSGLCSRRFQWRRETSPRRTRSTSSSLTLPSERWRVPDLVVDLVSTSLTRSWPCPASTFQPSAWSSSVAARRTTGTLIAVFAVGAALAGLFSGDLVGTRRQGRIIGLAIVGVGLGRRVRVVLVSVDPTSRDVVIVVPSWSRWSSCASPGPRTRSDPSSAGRSSRHPRLDARAPARRLHRRRGGRSSSGRPRPSEAGPSSSAGGAARSWSWWSGRSGTTSELRLTKPRPLSDACTQRPLVRGRCRLCTL